MARTPLFSELQNAVSAVAEAEERKVSPEQVTAERRATRREFLERAGVAGAAALGAAAFGRLASASGANPPPEVKMFLPLLRDAGLLEP